MQISTIGLDIAKNVFQVHGIDATERVVVWKQLRRSQVLAFFKALQPCLVGMEACATAHYWARELTKLGHRVRLMPAKDVKRQAQQERCRRCQGDLRGGAAADHAFCAGQIGRAAGPVDAASTRDLLMRQRPTFRRAIIIIKSRHETPRRLPK